jgi:hypothetical protein
MVTVLNASSFLPPVVVAGWPEGVPLLRPKALNKIEQSLLQDALDRSLVSMTCLRGGDGKDVQALFTDKDDSGEANMEDKCEQLEGIADVDADRDGNGGEGSSSGGVWAGPLAEKASLLF